jgi:hypothetical protein
MSVSRRHCLFGGALAFAGPTHAFAPAPGSLLAGELPPLNTPDLPGLHLRVARVAQRAGFNLEPAWRPWRRAYREARHAGDGLLFPLARTEQHELLWQWLACLAVDELQLWVRRDAPGCTPGHWAQPVGVLSGASHEALHGRGFRHIDAAPSEGANARKLARGHIAAWATDRSTALYWLPRVGLSPRHLQPPQQLGTVHWHLAGGLALQSAAVLRWQKAAIALGLAARRGAGA